MADMVNKWSKDMERKFRGNKGLTFKAGRPMKKEPIGAIRPHPDFAVVQFSCCDRHAKVPGSVPVAIVYCAYCGSLEAK
jgi:hypothetical protein